MNFSGLWHVGSILLVCIANPSNKWFVSCLFVFLGLDRAAKKKVALRVVFCIQLPHLFMPNIVTLDYFYPEKVALRVVFGIQLGKNSSAMK